MLCSSESGCFPVPRGTALSLITNQNNCGLYFGVKLHAEKKKKKKEQVYSVYSCNTCTIVGKMEAPTADFQIYIFLFSVMSAIQNLHMGEKKQKKTYEAEHFFLSVYFHLIAEGLGLQQAEIRALPVPCCSAHRTEEGWRG